MRLRPSPAMVVAFLALFVAIAGTATAAKLITGANIKNNSVTSRDIKNRTLLPRDFKTGRLPAGRPGPPGRAGPPGAGLTGLTYAGNSAQLTRAGTGNDEAYVVALCPAGRYPIGGNAYAVEVNPSDREDPVDPHVAVAEGFTVNVSTNLPSGWFGRATNAHAKNYRLYVDAICASAQPPPAPLSSAQLARRRAAIQQGSGK